MGNILSDFVMDFSIQVKLGARNQAKLSDRVQAKLSDRVQA